MLNYRASRSVPLNKLIYSPNRRDTKQTDCCGEAWIIHLHACVTVKHGPTSAQSVVVVVLCSAAVKHDGIHSTHKHNPLRPRLWHSEEWAAQLKKGKTLLTLHEHDPSQPVLKLIHYSVLRFYFSHGLSPDCHLSYERSQHLHRHWAYLLILVNPSSALVPLWGTYWCVLREMSS